jgi:hypothetical protein
MRLKIPRTALANECSVLPGEVRAVRAIHWEQGVQLATDIDELADERAAVTKTDMPLYLVFTIDGPDPVIVGAAVTPDLAASPPGATSHHAGGPPLP